MHTFKGDEQPKMSVIGKVIRDRAKMSKFLPSLSLKNQ